MTFKQNWEKADQQHPLPTGIIEKMIQLAYPGKNILSQEVLSGGCANLNIKINLDDQLFILRIYLRDKDAAYREQKLGVLLKQTVPLPLTHFIGDYAGYRFAITECMPGIVLRDILLSDKSQDVGAILYEVGVVLGKITTHSFAKAGFFDNDLNVIESTAQYDYRVFAKECLRNQTVVTLLGSSPISKINYYFQKYANFFPGKNEKSLVHADFDPSNILVQKINGVWKITAVLDWEFSFSGSVLCDVANVLRYSYQMTPAFEESFLQGLQNSGVQLPPHWQITVHMLNLVSLLDCLVRAEPKKRPNQCADICEVILYIMEQLSKIKIPETIKILSYNPKWPNMFQEEATLIQQTLGSHCITVHHIGSTSVPGLSAKEDIDIVCVVDALRSSLKLQEIGYVFKGELNIPLRYYFSKNTSSAKVNLHVVEADHGFSALNLCFRDYLRSHEDARQAYQNLKYRLISDPSSFERIQGGFLKYTLEKDNFIKATLDEAGFTGLTINCCTHYREWEAYHRICEEYIFVPINVDYDRDHSTISADNHYHIILYKGTRIVCVAHVEFLNANEAALRSLATDEPYSKQGYGSYMVKFLEKWIKHHGRQVIKMHARLSVEPFYRKLGYVEMVFDDSCTGKDYVDLGKILI